MVVRITANASSFDRLEIISQGNAAGQIGVAGNQVSFGGVPIATFDGGTGSTRLAINFNGNASVAAVEKLLRQVGFKYLSDIESLAPRTLQVTLSDGDGFTSATATKTVSVISVNDVPSIGGFDGTLETSEGIRQDLVHGVQIFDADKSNYDGGQLVFTITQNGEVGDQLMVNQSDGLSVQGNQVFYRGQQFATFTGGDAAHPLVFSLNQYAFGNAMQKLLNRIHFLNDSDAPSTAERTVKLEFSDGDGGVAEPQFRNIRIAPINDNPRIANFLGTLDYQQFTPPKLLDYNATVVDPDETNFDGGQLIVRISENAATGDRVSILPEAAGAGKITISGNEVSFGGVVIGTFNGGTPGAPLVVTFNANSNSASVQRTLQRIGFSNNVFDHFDPPSGPRTIKVTLSDGDGGQSSVVSKTVVVDPVNEPTVINQFAGRVTYTAGGPAKLIDYDATISDPDGGLPVGDPMGEIIVRYTQFSEAGDRLTIASEGTGAGKVQVDSATSQVYFGGLLIGRYDQGSGSSRLRIVFNADATQAAIQRVLQRISYFSVSDTPSTTPRQLAVTFKDSLGTSSKPVYKTIDIAT